MLFVTDLSVIVKMISFYSMYNNLAAVAQYAFDIYCIFHNLFSQVYSSGSQLTFLMIITTFKLLPKSFCH